MPAACERRPDHTVRINVDPPRRVADGARGWIEWRLVGFTDARLWIDSNDLSGHRSRRRSPHAAVCRMRDHAVDHVHGDLTIDSRIDFAILVDVVISATPALRLGFVARLVEDARVDPADRAAEDPVAVQRLVFVELNVMRIEADVHLLELPRLRIKVLHLPEAVFLRRE